MKAQYQTRPALTEKLQGSTLVNFNAVEVAKEDLTGSHTIWECDQVKVSGQPTKAEIIEAIMLTRYSTGAEIACINNKEDKPNEYAEYQEFRATAKYIAQEALKTPAKEAEV